MSQEEAVGQRMIDEGVGRRFITAAWIVAACAGALTVVMSFVGTYGFDLFNLLDAALILGLGYGVYRRSRACAIILLTYHLGNRFDMYQRTQDPGTAFGLVAIAVAVVYFLGILGTFAIHAIQRKKRSVAVL